MKRKNLTLPRLFFDLIKNKKDTDRLETYDTIFNYFFDEKQIDYENLSEVSQTIVACLSLEIRKLDKQFKNGCVSEKKLFENTEDFACENFLGQPRANQGPTEGQLRANRGPKKPPLRARVNDINYNNNIYNQSISQSVSQDKCEQSEKIKMLGHALEEVFEKIKSDAPVLWSRLSNTVKKIMTTGENLKINKKIVDREEVLEKIYANFHNMGVAELHKTVGEIFAEIDSRPVNNLKMYEIATLYNFKNTQNLGLSKKDNSNYLKHNYTSEQLNDVFDDLDSVSNFC